MNNLLPLRRPKQLINPPTLIEFQSMRFMVMDAPSEANLDLYLSEMEKAKVKDIVRVCEGTYGKGKVEDRGMRVHDWVFPDGEAPPDSIVSAWLGLVGSTFPGSISCAAIAGDHSRMADDDDDQPKARCIATHCVAGLGRYSLFVSFVEPRCWLQ